MSGFAFSNLLWLGLPLIGVPILIHLINLMRHRRVRWAAMEFLLASQKKNRNWVLLRQLLLLLLRMAAVAGIVMLLAQPAGRLFGGAVTHHIVLLDDSFSMSDRGREGPVFDEAKQAVEQIGRGVAELEGEQKFTLLRFSQAGAAGSAPAADYLQETVTADFANKLRERLPGIEVSETGAGPGPALAAVEKYFERATGETRVVYLVSDFRRRPWDNPGDLTQQLAEMTKGDTQLYLVNCADEVRPNLAVTRLEPGAGTRAAGVPLFIEVEVHNFGAEPAKNVLVHLQAEGDPLPLSFAEIAPGQSVQGRFQVRFNEPGPQPIAAWLDPDPVAADNFRYAVVDFPPPVPTLLVDDQPRRPDAEVIGDVFDPGGGVNTGVAPRKESSDFLASHRLDDFGAIWLLNPGRIDDKAIEALERYAAGGGGVAIFVGSQSEKDYAYTNDRLYRGGKGLLPVPLDRVSDLPEDKLLRAPDLEVTDHPLFRVFAGTRNSFLSLVSVRRYQSVALEWKPAEHPETRIIARLRNGAPLAVEKPFGKGRVVLLLTTAVPTWNNWSKDNPSFVVTVLELQGLLAARETESVSRRVGEPIALTLDSKTYGNEVLLAAPPVDHAGEAAIPKKDGGYAIQAVPGSGGLLVAGVPNTGRSGVYRAALQRLDRKQPETRYWAVNVVAEEGDLSVVDREALAERLVGVRYEYRPAREFRYDGEESQRDPSGRLVLLLLGLLLAEQILARSASYHLPRTKGAAALGGAA